MNALQYIFKEELRQYLFHIILKEIFGETAIRAKAATAVQVSLIF